MSETKPESPQPESSQPGGDQPGGRQSSYTHAGPGQHGGATAAPPVQVPLDEVMLAMDVVDTLRHQRAQVAAELDADQREAQLITRVQSIYASQGMEVPEEVIAQGVKALVEDRFVYQPPERSMGVRLAELYVERGKWARRGGLVLALCLAVWLAFYVPARLERTRLNEGYRASVAALEQRLGRLDDEASGLRRRLELAPQTSAGSASHELVVGARTRLLAALASAAEVRKRLPEAPPAESFAEDPQAHQRFLEQQGQQLDAVATQFKLCEDQLLRAVRLVGLRGSIKGLLLRLEGEALAEDERSSLVAEANSLLGMIKTGKLRAAAAGFKTLDAQLTGLLKARQERQDNQRELQRLLARLGGLKLAPALQREVDGQAKAARAAIAAADDRAASAQLGKLSSTLAELELSYELRIVTGRRQRSGVWRNTPGRRRNHYIIVEAVDARGRRLRLPIRNEENNRVERVRAFGIRVSEETYERVKQDKLDNGIIDQRRFGTKRRGERVPEYFYPVTGGRITRW